MKKSMFIYCILTFFFEIVFEREILYNVQLLTLKKDIIDRCIIE
jgi:hypothetical protein